MKKKKPYEPEKKLYVIIRAGRQKEKIEVWRFHEIVGALRWLGMDYLAAYDLAKWSRRSKPGDRREPIKGVTLEVVYE